MLVDNLAVNDYHFTRTFVGNHYEKMTTQEDFGDGQAQGWTAASETWAVSGGGYRQNTTNTNTNAYQSQGQNTALSYEWKARYTSGREAGLYLFASAATGAERGNSYRVWQDATHVRLYENASNVATLLTSFTAANAVGQAHSYKVSYDPQTGKFDLWRDGVSLGTWTDTSSPLTTGAYISLRTDASNVLFDNIVITRESKYYKAGGVRVAVRHNTSTAVSYLLNDHLGSTSVTANTSGAHVTELRYYPYGGVRYNPGNQITTYRYTGQRWDSGTSLYYYGARWYDPTVGRFLAADTIMPEPGNPQGLNRYSYTLNNPLKYTDPTGHWPIPPLPVGPIVREVARLVSDLPWMYAVGYASYREAKGDAPEALSLTLDWYYERGEAPRNIGSESEITQFLLTSKGLQEAREQFIKGGGKDMTLAAENAAHHEFTWEAVPELYKAIRYDDWSGSFLGSFDVEFRNVQGYKGSGKLVEITVVNDTGWQSATKIPFTKITIRKNVDRSEPGPGGTLWQHYLWKEIIDVE